MSFDWRHGAVIYQIFVDRFAPSLDLDAKSPLYASPRRLRPWDEVPRKGHYLDEAEVWTHELEFWGGDLKSLASKLPYLESLGIDAIYLNPIFEALTNHKYDTLDYYRVDPAYGSRDDLRALADLLHAHHLRLVLDGVFNHMGRLSPFFQEALRDPHSPWRPLFRFSEDEPIYWVNIENLPELDHSHPQTLDFLYRGSHSVLQSYLRDGIDGWRLDVAFELGFSVLRELTDTAHSVKPDSVVIGEVWNYPEQWLKVQDGILNMHARYLILTMLKRRLSPSTAARMWETMIRDAGLDGILKSWLVLDNHDTARLPHLLPEEPQRQMARVMQMALPGSPCLYYGSELGMDGGDDPEQRAPMRWDLADDSNPTLRHYRELLAIRRKEPALRYGECRFLVTERLFALLRATSSVKDIILLLVNPLLEPVTEFLQLPDSRLQDGTCLRDYLSPQAFQLRAGTVEVTIPAQTAMLLKPDFQHSMNGYNRYKGVGG